jgi:hypothetical protein
MIFRDVKLYMDVWEACQRTKVIHKPSHAPLHPHSIPMTPWEKISVDPVGPLLMSNRHDMIMVVVDWLAKTMVAILTTSTITMDKVCKVIPKQCLESVWITKDDY